MKTHINVMPQGWIQARLNDLSLINPKPDLTNFSDDLEISFIPMAAVETESGKVDLSQTRSLGSVRRGYTSFVDEDVIFAKITPCMENGKVAILKGMKQGMGFGSTEFHVSRPLDDLSGKFIFYFLVQRSYRKDAQRNMTGSAGQLRVSTIFFENSLIPLPPLPEQHRIVAKIEELFSELDKGVEALKTAQQQLKVFRQAVLKWAFEGKLTEEWRRQQNNLPTAGQLLEQINVEREKQAATPGKKLKSVSSLTEVELAELPSLPAGWIWVKLSSVGQIETGTTPPKSNPEFYGEDYPFFKPTDLDAGFNVRNAYDNLSSLGIQRARFLPENSILVTCIGATIGKTGIIRRGGASNQQINAVIPYNFVNPNYIYFQIIAFSFNKQILLNSSATTLPILNKSKFEVLPVAVCTFDEQNQIAQEIESRLSVADKIEETIAQSLKQAEALRQSILKKAFSGKLVPQDPNDEPAEKLLERIRAKRAAQGPVNGTVKRRGTGRKAASSPKAAAGKP